MVWPLILYVKIIQSACLGWSMEWQMFLKMNWLFGSTKTVDGYENDSKDNENIYLRLLWHFCNKFKFSYNFIDNQYKEWTIGAYKSWASSICICWFSCAAVRLCVWHNYAVLCLALLRLSTYLVSYLDPLNIHTISCNDRSWHKCINIRI